MTVLDALGFLAGAVLGFFFPVLVSLFADWLKERRRYRGGNR